MFVYMTLVLFSTVGFLNAACPRGEVTACALPFISANPSNLQETCRIAKAASACLEPYTADCTGNDMFDSLARSLNSMEGVCPSGACPVSAVMTCGNQFNAADSSSLPAMCSKTRTLLTCLAPHTTGCTGNVVFDSLTRSTNTMKGICGL